MAEDFKLNGPGKFYGFDMTTFTPDPTWIAKVAQTQGTPEIFEAFLETAFADVQK